MKYPIDDMPPPPISDEAYCFKLMGKAESCIELFDKLRLRYPLILICCIILAILGVLFNLQALVLIEGLILGFAWGHIDSQGKALEMAKGNSDHLDRMVTKIKEANHET